jgi:hypothetical protein
LDESSWNNRYLAGFEFYYPCAKCLQHGSLLACAPPQYLQVLAEKRAKSI